MKRYVAAVSCSALLLAGGWLNSASAQAGKAAAQKHIDIAKAAAYRPGHDLTALFERVCGPAITGKLSNQAPSRDPAPGSTPFSSLEPPPPRSEWYFPASKVFDNLYWLGSYGDALATPQIAGDSTWAVKTSEGIILIDTGQNFSAKELITDGLKSVGLDQTQIKYVIITHAHSDRYWGAKYLEDTYKPRMILSEADWHGN